LLADARSRSALTSIHAALAADPAVLVREGSITYEQLAEVAPDLEKRD
jgi:hypothetical protein